MRNSAALLLALSGSIVVVVILVTLATMLTTFGKLPADLLPAEHTIAVLHHPTPVQLERLKPWFSALEPSWVTADTLALALIKDPATGKLGVLRIETSTPSTDPAPANTLVQDRHLVSELTGSVLHVLDPALPSLMTDISYSTLLSARPSEASWVYVVPSQVSKAPGLSDQLYEALFLNHSAASALEWTENTLTVDTLRPLTPPDDATVPATVAGPFTSVSIYQWQLGSWWQAAEHTLAGVYQAELRGHYEKLLNTYTNGNVSFKYDVLPLLSHHTSLHLGTTLSGSLTFVLESYHTDPRKVATTLSRIHEGVRSTLPSSTVVKRALDQRFTSTNIRTDTSNVQDELRTRGGWQTRSTEHTQLETGMYSAMSDTKFVVSNRPELIEEAISANDSQPTDSGELGSGYVNPKLLTPQLQALAPALGNPVTSPLLPHFAGPYRWQVTQNPMLQKSSSEMGHLRFTISSIDIADVIAD